jgi:NADPH-dependent 7-cyano-7-deazaguanine reductase QueF
MALRPKLVTLHEDLSSLRQYLIEFLKREIFQTNVVEKIKTHIVCSIIFF